MKTTKRILIYLVILVIPGWLAAVENNDFYSRTALKELGPVTIEIAGEVEMPGNTELANLPVHDVIVRSSDLQNNKPVFNGAYHCQGYSLFDILRERVLQKKTAAEFPLPLDLLVIVENAAGERVVVSWGEIFYSAHLHRILIVNAMAPIVPSKTGKVWPLPDKPLLVCADDLYTVRELRAPTRLTIMSVAGTVAIKKGLKPLYAAGADVHASGKTANLAKLASGVVERTYPSVFYGRGMGFHGFEQFSGRLLRDALAKAVTIDRDALQRGYWVIAGADGYRVALSWSEIANRNDQAEFLLINRGLDEAGGRFSLYPAADFFSDRAVKALRELRYDTIPARPPQ